MTIRWKPISWTAVAFVVAASAAWADETPATDPVKPVDEVRSRLEEADRLYVERDRPASVDKSIELLRGSLAEAPHDAGWRLARVMWWKAEGTSDKEAKRALALEGRRAGEKAVELQPKSLPALYFTALCLGEYSHSVGIITALREGLEAKFRDPLIEVSQRAPDFDHGGAFNALGRYKFELPWPKRDYDASAAYLRRAIELVPYDIRARIYLAETLLARDGKGDVEEAKTLLRWVAETSGAPYDRGEIDRAKAMARAVKIDR